MDKNEGFNKDEYELIPYDQIVKIEVVTEEEFLKEFPLNSRQLPIKE